MLYKKLRSERGQLFVLLAISLLVIFGFIALAIDNVMTTDDRYKAKAVADVVCLSAAERYLVLRRDLGTLTVPDDISLIDQTVARANQVAVLNSGVTLVTNQHFGNLDDHYVGPPLDQGGPGGALYFGQYFRGQIENPPGSGTFTDPPCGPAPCFQPNNRTNNLQNDPVNAIRCEIHVNDDQGIGSIFRKAVNPDPVFITMTATAALTPQHLMFLLDVSPSVERTSGHLSSNPSCPAECVAALNARGECQDPGGDLFPCHYPDLSALGNRRIRGASAPYGFPPTPNSYTSLSGGTLNYSWYGPCPIVQGACTVAGQPVESNLCWDNDRTHARPHYDCKWSGLEAWRDPALQYSLGSADNPWRDIPLTSTSAPSVIQLENNRKKWRESYLCDNDGSGWPGDCTAPLDTGTVNDTRDCDANGIIVQDFVFDQWSDAEPLFSILEAINGALVAFRDRTVVGDLAGIIGFGSTSPPHCSSPPVVGFTPEMESRYFPLGTDIQTMIDATDTTQNIYRNKGFFRIGFEWTNTYEAIFQALTELSNHPDAENSNASLTLIYDGFSNCYDSDGDGSIDFCGGSENDHLTAASQIQTNLVQQLANHEIKLNVVLVGELGKPHTNLVRKPNGGTGCATDEDFRYYGLSFVNPSCQGPQSCGGACGGTCPDDWEAQEFIGYTGVNQSAYNLAVTTGGFFSAARPPCVPGTDITASLDSECTLQGNNWGTGVNPTPVITPETDAFGRLACDPTGASIGAQVQQTVQEDLEASAFTLVE